MLISLTGPSGSGKEYLKKELLRRFPVLAELCWTTTRELRPGEIQGVTRESVSQDEFKALESSDKLALVQTMFSHSYGIRTDQLRKESGLFLTEFHVDNLIVARSQELYPVAIALVPDSLAHLKNRLQRRGTESAEQISSRLASAKKEIATIQRNRHLFSLLVRFKQSNEHTVVDRVSKFLQPQINP